MAKFIFIGSQNESNLESSYERAAKASGHEVKYFNVYEETKAATRIKLLDQLMGTMNQVANHKANVKLAKFIYIDRPNYLFVFCNAPIEVGVLLYAQSLGVKTVLIWPDSVVNLQNYLFNNLKRYDLIACYSNVMTKQLQRDGYINVEWIPLAADKEIHFIKPSTSHQYDISFIGNWRPEREEILSFVADNFYDKKILLQGTGWKANVKNKWIKSIAIEGAVEGEKFAQKLNSSYLNLNIIDYTNFPSANMRFFEIHMAGALQLSSSCPEMEEVFIDGEHTLYYKDKNNLIEKVQYALDHPNEMKKIKKQGQDLLLSKHTYINRIEEILKLL